MGRNKIRIEKIKSNRNRNVTFNKRKKGLIKKAMELALLCDVEIFVTIVNNSGETLSIFSSHRNPDAFCETYLQRPITATDVCSLNEYSTISFDKTKEESKSISISTTENKDKDNEKEKEREVDKGGERELGKDRDKDKGSQMDPYLNTAMSQSSPIQNYNQRVMQNKPMDNYQMMSNMYLNQQNQNLHCNPPNHQNQNQNLHCNPPNQQNQNLHCNPPNHPNQNQNLHCNPPNHQNQKYYINDNSPVYKEPLSNPMYSDNVIFNRSNYRNALNYMTYLQPQEPNQINQINHINQNNLINNVCDYENLLAYYVKSSYVRNSNELSTHFTPNNNRYI